jgi:N-acyl homoserine lactone hydrolase
MGRVRQKRGERGVRRYFADDWRDETLPVNVFLIDHPQGYCLIDTGQVAAAAQPGYFARWHPFFRLSRFELGPQDEAGAQLAAAGVAAQEVRWVVLTHLHTDHVGGLAPFAQAEVVVARAEWERAQGISGRLRGYVPQKWPPGLAPTVVDFNGPAIGPFYGSYDVAGDGRLLLVPLAGHTRGHAGLVIKADDRCYLCAGDAALRAADLAATAPKVADWCRTEDVVILAAHDDLARAQLAGAAGTSKRPTVAILRDGARHEQDPGVART